MNQAGKQSPLGRHTSPASYSACGSHESRMCKFSPGQGEGGGGKINMTKHPEMSLAGDGAGAGAEDPAADGLSFDRVPIGLRVSSLLVELMEQLEEAVLKTPKSETEDSGKPPSTPHPSTTFFMKINK